MGVMLVCFRSCTRMCRWICFSNERASGSCTRWLKRKEMNNPKLICFSPCLNHISSVFSCQPWSDSLFNIGTWITKQLIANTVYIAIYSGEVVLDSSFKSSYIGLIWELELFCKYFRLWPYISPVTGGLWLIYIVCCQAVAMLTILPC